MSAPACWAPQGRALAAFLAGDREVAVLVHGPDDDPERVEVATFFRGADAFEPWERAALACCRGRVLDVGAGAGAHALALAAAGHPVTAVDLCPVAVEVMTARGVADAREATLSEVTDGPFDTVLAAMHGIGITGDLEGLSWWLADVQRVLAPGGRVVLDSRDPRGRPEPKPLPPDEDGRYPGSVRLALEWAGEIGPPFDWLFVDRATLEARAAAVGLATTVVHEQPDGRYVALLAGSDAGPRPVPGTVSRAPCSRGGANPREGPTPEGGQRPRGANARGGPTPEGGQRPRGTNA